MDEQVKKDTIDLGSDPSDGFDPFATDDDLDDGIVEEASTQPSKSELKSEASPNPLESAIAAAEEKDAEKAQQSIMEKPPVFDYAGANEVIDDSSKTFEELRIEKATDFPELDDGKRVSWAIEYGKITKNVADPKGTSIGKMKADIETSKAFLDSLKKAKDKSPVCKIKPKVTAQSKGNASYKGVYINVADAEAAGKVISIVPAKDGKVYEIRRTVMGNFITPVSNCEMLSDVRAGFIPALPLIPEKMLMQIIAFFRHFSHHGSDNEALLNLYWDRHKEVFVIDAPKQVVTKTSVRSQVSDEYTDDRYIHYMDIHSHNTMPAFFSETDDADEKATRLYTVVGELHKGIPDIKTRISNGGKFWPIDTSEVFELIDKPFPEEWKEKVQFRACHDESDDLPWHSDRLDAL